MPGQKSICESILDYCYSIWVAPKEAYYPSSDDEDCAISRRGISKRDKAHISEMEIRNRRKKSQQLASQKLNNARVHMEQPKSRNIVDRFTCMPGYFPEFGERVASAENVREPITVGVKKKSRSAPDMSKMSEASKKSERNRVVFNAFVNTPVQKSWSIDETKLELFETEGRVYAKYKEFLGAITGYNVGPTDPSFEKTRWGTKLTHQKSQYSLWSARLTESHRVTYMVNNEERVVTIITVGKHD